jgi:hypothetical protein
MRDAALGGNGVARFATAAAVAAALAFGVAACGDDDEESADGGAATEATETAGAEEVTVTATEYEFDLSATPTADTKSITFDNQGKKFHVMIYARLNEGFTVDQAIELQGEKGSAETLAEAEAAPGKSATVEVKGTAEPGSYVMLCPIEDKDGAHYELGQLEEFELG